MHTVFTHTHTHRKRLMLHSADDTLALMSAASGTGENSKQSPHAWPDTTLAILESWRGSVCVCVGDRGVVL